MAKDPSLPSMKDFWDITGYLLAPKQPLGNIIHAHTFAGKMQNVWTTKRTKKNLPQDQECSKVWSQMFMKKHPYTCNMVKKNLLENKIEPTTFLTLFILWGGYLLCTWLMRASSNSGNTVLSVMRLDHQAWSMFQTSVYLWCIFSWFFFFGISTKLLFRGCIKRFIWGCIYFGGMRNL